MASSAILRIDIIADAAKAVTAMNQVGGTAGKQSSKLKTLRKNIVGAFSVGAVVAFGKEAVTAAADDAAAQAGLATALKNTTGATDKQVAAAESYITSLSKQTATADDELRPALATLTRATGDQAEAQDLLALSTDIAAGTGKDLETVANAVAKAQQGNLGPLGKLTGGMKDAHGEALTLDEMMAKAATTFSDQAAVAADTTAGKMKGAQIAMAEMQETVGTALLPVIGALSEFLSENISWLGPLALAIGAVVAATWLWNIAVAANPITLIILAIIALIAIVVLLIKNWDKVVKFLKGVWENIKKVAIRVWNAIGGAIEKVWDAIKKAVTTAVEWVQDKVDRVFSAVKRTVKTIWEGIKKVVTGVWDGIKTAVETAVNWVRDKVGDVFRGIKKTVKTIWDAVETYFTTLWTDITTIFQTAWDFFEDFVDFLEGIGDTLAETWDTVTETIELVWENVVDGVKSAVNVLIDGLNFLIRGINKAIDIVNKLPFPDISHIPEIPRLAKGGVLTGPSLFLGGEAGTEIVTPEKLLRSILREEGGIGGGSYVLNMNVRRADPADVAWGFRRLELLRTGR